MTDASEQSWIADLLQRKADGREADLTGAMEQQLDQMLTELAAFESYGARAPKPTKASPDALDAILRQWTN